jgi:hypothetical protein
MAANARRRSQLRVRSGRVSGPNPVIGGSRPDYEASPHAVHVHNGSYRSGAPSQLRITLGYKSFLVSYLLRVVRASVSTVGTDVNQGGTNNDGPTRGVNDTAVLPSGQPGTIVSEVDSRGVAVRNGIDGEEKIILDGRLQYIHRFGKVQAGLFLEVYNLLNRPTSAIRPERGTRSIS